MNKIIAILVSLSILGLTSGCQSTAPRYAQQSPMVTTMKDSGYTQNTRREEGSLRYDHYTTLGSHLKQAGEVEISVTFQYHPPRRDYPPRGTNCRIHVKTSDTTLAGVKRCDIEHAGQTFVVYFRTKEHGTQSFDLRALGGNCEGGCPFFFWSGGPFRFTYSDTHVRNVRYLYVGPDPFM